MIIYFYLIEQILLLVTAKFLSILANTRRGSGDIWMVKPISADDKSILRRAGAMALALTLASIWRRILRRRLFRLDSRGCAGICGGAKLKGRVTGTVDCRIAGPTRIQLS